VIRDGADVLIVSTGFMTMRALDAAVRLGPTASARRCCMCPRSSRWTPTILAEAGRGGRLVVTAENHSVVGGLGEAVAGLLLTNGVTPGFRMIGLPDAFLEAGALPTLHEMYGLTVDAVVRRIKGWL
jgi:transketolase